MSNNMNKIVEYLSTYLSKAMPLIFKLDACISLYDLNLSNDVYESWNCCYLESDLSNSL